MSSGVPNLCVDIFSHMSTLLTNFNANVAQGSFTHGDGFEQVAQQPQTGSTEGQSFE